MVTMLHWGGGVHVLMTHMKTGGGSSHVLMTHMKARAEC